MNRIFTTFGVDGANPCDIDPNCNVISDPEGFLSTTAQSIINILLIAAGVVAAIAIIYGGVSMMTAAGDPGKITKGKKAIFGGVIGLIIVLLAGAIVNFVLANI